MKLNMRKGGGETMLRADSGGTVGEEVNLSSEPENLCLETPNTALQNVTFLFSLFR